MPIVSESCLQHLQLEELTLEQITECLGYFPEVFHYLQQRQSEMGQTRPIVTFASAATVWAFKSNQDQMRAMPQGLLYHLWSKLAQGCAGDRVCAYLEEWEPHMWQYFVRLTAAAAVKEDWDQGQIAASALVYAPILTSCIYMFWPEQELQTLEQGFWDCGLHGES